MAFQVACEWAGPMTKKKQQKTAKKKKQGRIHGYSSRVWVGRGLNRGHHIIWAGAVRPKTAKKTKTKQKSEV